MPDWNKIKAEYITTSISYRKLADKWGVSFRTLADHATKEHWAEERNNYRNSVAKQTVQKIASRTSTSNANKLVRLQQAADSMSEVIADIFNDTEQFKRHIITTGLGMGETKVECRVEDKFDTKAIKDLTGALKDLAIVMRSVYDLPTAQEKSAMDIAAERLALDKSKADSGMNDDDETGVVEITPVLPGGDENA